MAKNVKELFDGIKPEKHERPKRKEFRSEPVPTIVSDDEAKVTIALTMPRKLFEQYCGKDRNRFRDAMVRQLEKKFE